MAGVTPTHPVSPRTLGEVELMLLEGDKCSCKIFYKNIDTKDVYKDV